MPENKPKSQPPQKPPCILEVVNPDDVLIISVNERWHRSFTSNSDRYPLRIPIPPEFLNDGWNLITGAYTNVAIEGPRNDATVEYRVLLGDQPVVKVSYLTDVARGTTFSINFKDTFHTRGRQTKAQTARRASNRFQDLMQWQNEEGEEGGGA